MVKHLIFALVLLAANPSQATDWSETDKQKHFAVSASIASLSYGLTDSAWVSLGSCLAVGLAKELYDRHDYGEFSSEDMQANAVGCGVGLVAGYLFFGEMRGLSIRF